MHRPIQLTKTTPSRRTSQVTRPNEDNAIGTHFPTLIAGLFPVVSILVRQITFPLLLLAAGLLLVQPCAGEGGTWTATGSLATARYLHTATLLPSGKALVAGGANRAELYDPATGLWTATGSLATKRDSHTATLLPDGQVLVAGGANGTGFLASAELYDPATGLWTVTGRMTTTRFHHTATLLPNGQVLVAGGNNKFAYLASAELYDPASGLWTATGSLAAARENHTATLLPNGKVLVAGGDIGGPVASAELFDPATGLWTATGDLTIARFAYTATLLPNGKVLVAGGEGNTGWLASAELYDPASGLWTATGSLATARERHTATLLPNGKVLVAGGTSNFVYLASAELYDPASGLWTATGSMATNRYLHTATLLPNGQVLVAGGAGDSGALASAELYTSDGGGGPTLVSAASRMTHGSAGDFDIDMPLTGPSGVEDRQRPPMGGNERHEFLAIFTFDTPVTSGDVSVTGGIGFVQFLFFSGNEIQVFLSGVSSAQVVTLTVSNVNGLGGSADVHFGFLVGDVNGDRIVDKADADQIVADKGQAVNGSNFRDDINLTGVIGGLDFNYVKAHKNQHL